MDQCKSQNNDVFNSYEFYSRRQKDDEKFESFLMDIFQLGKRCHFKNYDKQAVERVIRDKIVFGIKDSNLRNEIFNKGYSELCDIINLCRSSEKNLSGPSNILKDVKDNREKPQTSSVKIIESGEASKSFADRATCCVWRSDDVLKENEDFDLEKGEVLLGSLYFDGDNVLPLSSENLMDDSDTDREKSDRSSLDISPKVSGNGGNKRPRKDESDDDDDIEDTVEKDEDDLNSIKSRKSRSSKNGKVFGSDDSDSSSDNDVFRDNSDSSSNDEDGIRNDTENSKENPQMKKKNDSLDFSLFNDREFFKCDECGERFSQRFKYNNHISKCKGKPRQEASNSREIFQCLTCPQICYSQEELEQHELIHPYTTSYRCDDCGRVFYTRQALGSHLAYSHNKGDSDYSCTDCDEIFHHREKLRRHMADKHQKILNFSSKNFKSQKQFKQKKKSKPAKFKKISSDELYHFK